MRLFRPFPLIPLVYPEAIFRVATTSKELWLTFDDGPHPDSTPHILEILDTTDVKAVFFCSGHKAEKYPTMVSLITAKGHIVGNHGYNHVSGLTTNVSEYIENVARADEFTSANLFRPPYGRICMAQYRQLSKKYRIVFWDLMSYDFDERMGSKKVLNTLKKKIRPGSVIVLHDKTSSSVLSFLAEFIKYAEGEGYRFTTRSFSGINTKRPA